MCNCFKILVYRQKDTMDSCESRFKVSWVTRQLLSVTESHRPLPYNGGDDTAMVLLCIPDAMLPVNYYVTVLSHTDDMSCVPAEPVPSRDFFTRSSLRYWTPFRGEAPKADRRHVVCSRFCISPRSPSPHAGTEGCRSRWWAARACPLLLTTQSQATQLECG